MPIGRNAHIVWHEAFVRLQYGKNEERIARKDIVGNDNGINSILYLINKPIRDRIRLPGEGQSSTDKLFLLDMIERCDMHFAIFGKTDFVPKEGVEHVRTQQEL